MPRDLEQLLVDSAVRPSRPVDLDAIERGVRRRRATRWASGGVGAAALIAVVAAVVVASPPSRPAIDTPVTRPTPPAPLVTEPPSQSPEDAARDGVVPAVAALPFDQRVVIQTGHDGELLRVPLGDSGVWVVSGLGISGDADELLLGDHDRADAVHGRDFVHVHDYSEVLLLDASETTILRAFPIPGFPTYELEVGDDAVYCSRQGDGGLPDSHLCRIDLRTYEWSVRIFPLRDGPDLSDFARDEVEWLPPGWVIDRTGVTPVVDDLLYTRGRLLGVSESPTEPLSAFDPVTLEVVGPAEVGAARDFGLVTAIDGTAGTITIDAAVWREDPEGFDSCCIEDAGRDPVTYLVTENVSVTMTLYWDYQCCPEVHSKTISWTDFVRIWDDDAIDAYPAKDVEYAREAYYRLLTVDGEVVQIDQQYQP